VKNAEVSSTLRGRWRITSMEMWDQTFVDAEVEGYIEFGPKGLGSFQFGYVSGDIDYRGCTRDGIPGVEWSWEGNDEMEPASGRGWAVLKDNELHGTIFFHHGDDSGFEATKISPKSKRPKRG
jgi:hypothetical protein